MMAACVVIALGVPAEINSGVTWLDHAASAYLEAIQADDVEALRDAIAGAYSDEALEEYGLEGWTGIHFSIAEQIPEFEAYHVAPPNERGLEVLTRLEGDGGWLSWEFIAGDVPGRLRGIKVRNAAEPSRWLPDYSSCPDLDTIASRLRRDVDSPGLAIALAVPGGSVRTAVDGVRRSDGGEPLRESDMVHLGSCTKAATAMLVATIVDEGLLCWDETLSDLLGDDFEIHKAYQEVTLAEVARHRAGLVGHSDGLQEVIERYATEEGTNQAQRERYLKDVLAAEPEAERGTMHYSNAGYSLLAHVCERALGIPYERSVIERVLEPARIS